MSPEHFDGAGQTKTALTYALLAARQARQQFSFEVVVEHFEIALRNSNPSDKDVRFRAAHGIGEALMLLGLYPEAEERLVAALDDVEDPVLKATIELLVGEVAFKQGHLQESLAYYESGLRRLGNRVPRTTVGLAWSVMCESLVHVGHCIYLSVRIGDTRANCSTYLLSRAKSGKIPFDDMRKLFPSNPGDIMSTCNVDKAEGYWHLSNGRTREAVEAFENACRGPIKHRVFIYHTVAAGPALAKALRVEAKALEQTDESQARKTRTRALRIARRSGWLSVLFQTERAIALRELSLVYRDLGKLKRALRFAERSCAVAERQSARYELALSSRVAAQIREQLGDSNTKDEIELAEATVREIETAVIQDEHS